MKTQTTLVVAAAETIPIILQRSRITIITPIQGATMEPSVAIKATKVSATRTWSSGPRSPACYSRPTKRGLLLMELSLKSLHRNWNWIIRKKWHLNKMTTAQILTLATAKERTPIISLFSTRKTISLKMGSRPKLNNKMNNKAKTRTTSKPKISNRHRCSPSTTIRHWIRIRVELISR
jgi:hypothetical protein